MKLTEEQRDAVQHKGHAVLIACPGSGKTRAIIAKLLRSVDAVRDTTRRVACITYTNAAVDEIRERMGQYGSTGDEEYCDVSTIHAFCQNNILRYFHWMIPEISEGYSVLPSDSDAFREAVDAVADDFGIDQYGRQAFESLNRHPNGSPITPPGIPKEAAVSFWSKLLDIGSIDFCNLVYYSYRILADAERIRKYLAARFAFALVDEFQDTSALQTEILRLIVAERTTECFLVGDAEQSIYRFAGAERDLMFTFSTEIGAKKFPLTGNFRSSPPIVKTAERIISREPAMYSAGESKVFNEEPLVLEAESAFAALTDEFLPRLDALEIPLGDAAVLAPSWFQLMPLGRMLREYGVAVVGPGARPYKRSHLFASIAEQVCAYIEKPSPHFVPSAERALFFLVQNATGKANFRVFSFDGRRILYSLLDSGTRLAEEHPGARDWLRAAAKDFGEILCNAGLVPQHTAAAMCESAEDILRDMIDKKVDVMNLALTDLGMFADPRNNLKLLTFHGAKGREFSAVALIALQDGLIPYHNKYNTLTQEGLEESRRLFYVAVTRAKRLLLMCSDRSDWRPSCRFLKEL